MCPALPANRSRKGSGFVLPTEPITQIGRFRSHYPISNNLALRFLLELFALFSLGYWGWTQHSGLARVIWTIGLPLIAAVAWGTLRVPGHPGDAPVAVPGIVRLLLEVAIFGGAIWALYAAGRANWALIYGIIVLVHYLLSYDYVIELLRA